MGNPDFSCRVHNRLCCLKYLTACQGAKVSGRCARAALMSRWRVTLFHSTDDVQQMRARDVVDIHMPQNREHIVLENAGDLHHAGLPPFFQRQAAMGQPLLVDCHEGMLARHHGGVPFALTFGMRVDVLGEQRPRSDREVPSLNSSHYRSRRCGVPMPRAADAAARGIGTPREVKRKMSNFNTRHRGESPRIHHQSKALLNAPPGAIARPRSVWPFAPGCSL